MKQFALRVQPTIKLLLLNRSIFSFQVFLDHSHHILYDYGNFCVAFTTSSQSSGSDFQFVSETSVSPTYSICYNENPDVIPSLSDQVHPVAIFISDFFILVTLALYLVISDLRQSLFGKITVGFLVNVFLCYLFIGISHSLDLTVK